MDQGKTGFEKLSPRWLSVAGLIFADVFLVEVSLLVSLGLTYNFDYPGGPVQYLWLFGFPVAVIAFGLLAWRRLHRINTRYLGLYDLLNMLLVGLLLGAALRAISFVAGEPGKVANAWTGPVLFAFLSTFMLALGRLYQRLVAHRALRLARTRLKRVVIVGAGDAGESLFRELDKLNPVVHHVVAFLDDDPRKHGTTIHGVDVVGPISQIKQTAEDLAVDEIMIALPSATPEETRRVFNLCSTTSARVRAMPSLSRFVQGDADLLAKMRDVRVDDLLRRDSLISEVGKTARYVGGERVLITGGGGSIGSELARQVAALSPASLILVGKGENSIFEIDQELRDASFTGILPVVCDVRDAQGLEAVFRQHKPSVVFHAAAHKHVPLMESVPIEAVRNNVFGTLNLVELCVRHGVQKFILVSTDKAVNPENVMGATKRVAELIVSAFSNRSETSFAIVRFGNVLGSRGSLIPILKKQILGGGPVTLTHPEMTRFFMTIPEAVQLIVQAGAMGEKGEIYILDMGEPVSIVDLAKDMVRLHGLVPGQDIEIKFTGIRPGEKIHEELAFEKEDLTPSSHEQIRYVKNNRPVHWDWLKDQLAELDRLCQSGDAQACRAFLMELAWERTMPPVTSVGQ